MDAYPIGGSRPQDDEIEPYESISFLYNLISVCLNFLKSLLCSPRLLLFNQKYS